MTILKIVKSPYTSLVVNFLYAVGNCFVGFYAHSWWFITAGAYYSILAITRFSVLQVKRKANGKYNTEIFAKQITGILLVLMSFCIIGVNVLSALNERGTVFHKIIMIAIATYTFTKITISIIGMVKAKRIPSPIIQAFRNISFADALVSVLSLQRSMLVSFPGMNGEEILIFNILTGTAVWLAVLFLGVNLIRRKNMTKAKITKATMKAAEAMTGSYEKIERGVVDGYKKIEQGVVEGFTRIEDKFVEAYLTKDGETVEEAKERLKRNNK